MKKRTHFIIIDDDTLTSLICRLIIQKTAKDSNITVFYSPPASLEYIRHQGAQPGENNFVIFLDLNMPIMDGWEFLEQYSSIYQSLKDHSSLYVLSSSINPADKERALGYQCVSGYIEKPLTVERVTAIMEEMNSQVVN